MGHIHVWLGVIILAWMAEATRHKRYDLTVYPTICVQPVDNARNEIVEEFLKSDATHLLFVDSDTLPPIDAIDKLLAVNQPIVSGLTPIIEINEKEEIYRKWNCVGVDSRHLEPNKGVLPIIGAGSSCILIKREVFEKLERPWYRFLYEDDNGKKTLVSEDIHFLAKAVGKKIPAYCDTSVICKHNKAMNF